jgi:hypothetical protein
MSRPLSERVRDWRWWGEQALHLALGALVGACTLVEVPVLGCLAAAAVLATVREFVDQWPIESWGDAAVDWACTALGGLVLGVVIWGVTR